MYKIEKNLNKLNQNQPTFFLDPKEQLELSKKIKKRGKNGQSRCYIGWW